MKEINGDFVAKGLKIGLVVSRFNSFLTEQLVKGALDAFVRLGGSEKDIILVNWKLFQKKSLRKLFL